VSRTYHYREFDIKVAVEADFSWKTGPNAKTSIGFLAVVRISKAGASVAVFPQSVLANPRENRLQVKLMHSWRATVRDDVLSMTCSTDDQGTDAPVVH
jgi:hypothetical protein